jgi:hypothetical protein
VADASVWTPALFSSIAKYSMMLLGSVLNSAFIVLLVTGLRALDRRVGRGVTKMVNRRITWFSPVQKIKHIRRARAREMVRSREAESFLLSPVFR